MDSVEASTERGSADSAARGVRRDGGRRKAPEAQIRNWMGVGKKFPACPGAAISQFLSRRQDCNREFPGLSTAWTLKGPGHPSFAYSVPKPGFAKCREFVSIPRPI
jgi:hypothetical protein